MGRKRRTEITIEMDQVLVVRWRWPQAQGWCPHCPRPVQMITVREAASLARVSSRQIYYWVAIEALHFNETADGRLWLCLDSLVAHATAERVERRETTYES